MPSWLTTLLDLLGAALVVAGLTLWSVPVAFVVAGAFLLLASWRGSHRPANDEEAT